MKKLLLFVLFLLTTIGFSQPITVSSTTYTVPQLVNNVLINSPCVSATNVTWRTGTDFSSSNGIGFFQNTNTNFPMQSGVVLSTGNAMNAPGPNTSLLNDGSASWSGDANLEATLAASGITMVSKNATILEFDFTPISSNFSFDFIFASEEYGNFQCQYSDAFAFLLTNMNTGTTTNLAVVPNTNNPISVVTIRDFLYNSSCPSANSQYFGSFNGGSNASSSAINFNGQTTVLTAASVLTPGVPYHIKLVIADRLDPQSDSAIFISSDTFNIGQDVLGLDLTTADNTALCFGQTHTLATGLSSSDYTFVWERDGATLTGETSPTLVINQAGTYTVTYTNNANFCQPVSDSVTIEFYPQISSPNPNNLYKCDTAATSYTYDLDLNTSRVKQGLDSATVISYHLSQNDATNNINPLPLQYVSSGNQTIYVRIELPNGCFRVKSFELLIAPPPTATQPQDMAMCARPQTLDDARFNLTSQNTIILNGQSTSIYSVRFYTSLNNATNDINPIGNSSTFISSGQTIYVRVYNTTDPACYSLTSFTLIVNPIPTVDILEDVVVCSDYTLQPLTNGNYFTGANGSGIPLFAGDIITETQTIHIYNQPGGPGTCGNNSSFTVTIIDVSDLAPDDVTSCGSYTLPSLDLGKYYTGPGATGAEIPAGTVINSSQIVYYYFVTETPPVCIVDADFNVTILPTIEVGERPNVFDCLSYTLPALSIGNYYTGPNGSGNQLAIGTQITSSQTIYVFATTTGTTPCSDQDIFEVVIGLAQPPNISQCNGYTLPQLPVGNYFTGPMGTGQLIPDGTVINSSATIYIYATTTSGGTNCTDNLFFTLDISQPAVDVLNDTSVCESYTLPSLTNGEYFTETDGAGTQLYAGDVILSTQTIFIFKRLNAGCFNQSSFTITINPLPAISSRSDIDICDQYVLTALQVGDYFTGPNGTGDLLPGGTVITTSQMIYIYATSGNTTPVCTAQNSFQINIFSTSADVIADVTACDSFTLPSLSVNNKYFTQSGGSTGTGTEILPGTVITATQTIYIFKESEIRTSFSCIDETSFTVTINQTPLIPAMSDIFTCNSYTLAPLTVGNYYTAPNGTGTLLNAGYVVTSSQIIYVYANTNTSPDCSSQISFDLTIFNVDTLPDVTICENFILPALAFGQYYTGPNGTGTLLNAGTALSTSQTVYVYAMAPFNPSCSDESLFTVTIIDTPVANIVPVSQRTVCDEDGTNDSVTSFDLTSLTPTILGNQTTSEFTIAYYPSLTDASNQTNAITTTTLSTIYLRVSNTLAPSCFDIKPIAIIVNALPVPTPIDGIICFDSETQTLLNAYTIHSGLSATTHTFLWTNETGTTVGTSTNYTAILPGVYTLVATRTTTGCVSEPISVTVSPSEPAVVTYTVVEDFADSQSIHITATGQGNNFEYQLDNGPFQDSPVFENVNSGIHTVTVVDRNGCGSTTIQVVVINYPKYFTPNGDGIHDSWNIKDLSDQPSAKVIIYDRYGKIITQIKPSGYGWDGTYNGNMMPSDDYWFSVSYTDENQVDQEFRAHFAMKR